MKNLYLIPLLLISAMLCGQDRKVLIEVLDASEANRLYSTLKTESTNTPGWPLPVNGVEEKVLPVRNSIHFVPVEYIDVDDKTVLVKVKLTTIQLVGQNLKGVVPAIKLDSLEELSLGNNEITGISPDFKLNHLKSLSLASCKLTAFPRIQLPSLTSLYLFINDMVGEIPSDLNTIMPNLEVLLCDENKLTGKVLINHPKLRSLILDNNLLSGTLKNITAPNLYYLDASNNLLEGLLDLNYLPSLISLELNDNKFNSISNNFKSSTPALKYFSVISNSFHFDDLMALLPSTYEDFSYRPQRPVVFSKENANNKWKLTANVAGAENRYQWYYIHPSSKLRNFSEDTILLYIAFYLSWSGSDTSILKVLVGENKNFLEIPKSENPSFYGCGVSNTKVPDLTISAVNDKPQNSNCWENDYLSFCIKEPGAKWEAGKKNEIKSIGSISINDFVSFIGSLTIDTINLKLKIDGKIFVADIPLPGGNQGNFTLADGIYELDLAGKNGAITGFINDGLSRFVPEIGGLKIKLDSLSLVGGRIAKGVSISFSIKINNITPCGESSKKTAEIKIRGVSITSDGLMVEELESENMGFAPSFCLKELKAKYDYKEDELSLALTLLTPFLEIGGGIELKKGSFETVEFKAELQELIIPLGPTGIGVIGCEGKVSKITTPPFNLKFGGIISAVANDHLFRLTTSAEFIPPATLKFMAGDGKFFNPPAFGDDWWLAEGGIYGSLDFKSYRLKMGGNINMAPYKNKSDKKAFMSSGSIDMAVRKDPIGMVFTGLFKGKTVIPELREGMPYDWLNAKLGLPYSVSGEALLVYKPTAKFISGDVDLGGRIGQVHYDINLSKRYNEEGFFTLILKEVNLSTTARSAKLVSFTVPPQTKMAIIKATGKRTIPVLEFTAPGGQIINENNPGANAEVDKILTDNKLFWTLYLPQAGTWSILNTNNDSLDIYFLPNGYSLDLKAKVGNSFADIYWNNHDFKASDSIDFYIDDDTSGFDGIFIGATSANQSQFKLDYNKAEGYCSFYVYAISKKEGLVKAKYLMTKIENPVHNFQAPDEFKANYTPSNGILNLQWNPAVQNDVAGYVLSIDHKSGNEIISILSSTENFYHDTIAGLIDPLFYIQAYGNNGQLSCPISSHKTVAIKNDRKVVLHEINIYPNPCKSRLIIEIANNKSINSPVVIYNLLGQVVKTISVTKNSDRQQYIEVYLNDLINGQYFVSVVIENALFVKKVLLLN